MNNEHSPMIPANVPGASHSQTAPQAPASLIPSVLKRLEQEQAALPPGTPLDQLVAALRYASWSTRARAAFLLGEMGEQIPVEPLIAALRDEDANVRMAAVRSLGKLGTRAPLDQLKAAQQDSDWLVQETATFTVANLEKQLSTAPISSDANNAIEEDSDSDDTSVEITPLPELDSRATLRSAAQHVLPIVPKRKIIQHVLQGVVAALLIAGIALSWLAIAQRLHPAANGHLGNTGATPAIVHSPIPSHPKNGRILFTYHAQETVDYPIWSINGHYMTLVTESSNNDSANVYVWSAFTNRLSRAFSFTHLPPQNWSYDSDGVDFLLVQPGKLQIWNAVTGNSLFVYSDHSNQQPAYALSNDSKFIAIAINQTTLCIWNINSEQVSLTFHINVPAPYAIMWSPDDSRILVLAEHIAGISDGGIFSVYSSQSGSEIATIRDTGLIFAQWSPDGKYLSSTEPDAYNPTNTIWDAATGHKLSIHQAGSQAVYWLCDDQRLYTLEYQQNPQLVLDIWDASTGKTLYTLNFTGQSLFSHDCKYIALYDQKDTRIVDAATGHTLLTHHTSAVVEYASFSNSSSFLASASKNNTLQIWDAASGGVYSTYHVASNAINNIDWSPDDALIAISSADNIVQILQAG
ncbi:MAG TPA: HEAT repeat domain-containing protein [Ktedonobacteraceae bacterium]